MDKLGKLSLIALVVIITVSYFFVKPLVYNDNDYKVIIVNVSEHDISTVTITGPGIDSAQAIGSILVGNLQDYVAVPNQDGILRYSITQNGHILTGIVNASLKKGDVGEIYVVIREMYKVEIHDWFDT